MNKFVHSSFWLVKKAELVKTTEKLYGPVADNTFYPMDTVLTDKLQKSSSGSNMKVSESL